MSAELPVPVEVDGDGTWSVGGVPMVLVPRHLLTNTLDAAERAVGTDPSATALRVSGHRSARQWCAQQRERLGLDAVQVVPHYLDQLSRRGWGRFRIESLDLAAGTVTVTVASSALAQRGSDARDRACWVFEAWLEGALDQARESLELPGGFAVSETRCRASGATGCRFEGTVTDTGGAR